MPLDVEQGRTMLQLLTSRYDRREWRKKIEKTLSLPQAGLADEVQRAIFLYLKYGLKAYKSRRADADSWIVGGYPTREVIERAKFNPAAVGPSVGKDDVSALGTDPGPEVDEDWWNDMLVAWFEEPEQEEDKEKSETGEEAPVADGSPDTSEKTKPA
jgi:hypothetical protein